MPLSDQVWPYQFANLTSQEKHARRELLDRYGLVAHCSALTPVLLLGAVHLARRYVNRALRAVESDSQGSYSGIPSSPAAAPPSPEPLTVAAGSKLRTAHTRLQWWMDDEIRFAGARWGIRREWIIAVAWTCWLLVLYYFHLTKRFGIVAASQLPIQYLMSLKAMNPFAWAFASSHERVNRYHRVLGRIIYGLLTTHVVLYNVYFVLAGKWTQRFFAPVVFCGVLAALLFYALLLTAVRRLREVAYRVFFITHLVVAVNAPILLLFHARSARWYLVECLLIFVFDRILRKRCTTLSLSTIEAIPGTALLKVTAPLPPGHFDAFRRASPGLHVYVSLPAQGSKAFIPSSSQSSIFAFSHHPYSVASLIEEDEAIRFVVRTRRGAMSRALADFAAAPTTPSPDETRVVRLSISGPYGAMKHRYPELLASRASHVLFVAGGVGATFVLPVYQAVQAEMPLARIQMIWAVRAPGDATWSVSAAGQNPVTDDRIQLFLTGVDMAVDEAETETGTGTEIGIASGQDDSAVEMQPFRTRIRSRVEQRRKRRPNFDSIVDDVFRLSGHGLVAVVICGPKDMADHVRRCVRPWVMRGRRVWYHNESFAW